MTTYKELDYLESTGTQYVVSPLVLSGDNYRIECKYDKEPLEQTTMFGYQKSGSNGQQIMCIDYAPQVEYKGDLFWHGSTDSAGNENRRKLNIFDIGLNEVVIEANNNTLTYNINGRTDTYTVVSAFQPQADTGVWIFGNSREAAAGGHQEATAKFYYFRAYQNNVLLCDLIPVLDFNDTPAVYDKVNDVLYYNQGTGDFLYQRKGYCCEVEYLESTGTQYIDTGYIPTAKTSFDLLGVDMDYTTGMIRFGSRVDTIKENYCFTTIASSDFRFTYGSGPNTTSIQYIYSTHKLAKKVNFDASTKICTITFNDDTTESSSAFNTTPLTSAAQSIYLFAFNNNGSAVYGTSKQSGLKIYEDGVLVRDYIPVLDWEMTPCFYDKITETKVYNLGTGQFNYGAKETEPSIQLRRKFNMLLASHKKLVYTPLKYLESSDTQWIDTGIQYTENVGIEISFAFVDQEITAAKHLIGGQVQGSNPSRYNPLYCTVVDGVYKIRTLLNIAGTSSITRNFDTNIHVLQFNRYPNKKVVYDGVDEGTVESVGTGNNINLFRRNLAAGYGYCSGRIYACRIWDGTTLVRDFIPVLDKNGTPCMLDRVENKLYYNQGTGTFTYEEWDYTPCDCVYTDGNAYTNTLLYGNSNTKMEMTFDITTAASGNTGTMGSRNTANSQLLAIGYGGTVLASDFNNSSYRPYRSSITYELNKKYTAYTSKEKRSIVEADTGVVLDENTTLCTDTLSTGVLLLGAETGISVMHNGKIYGAKIWEGAALIRDYIPVVDVDNKCGFYDKCLNIISYSLGSSDFVGHFIENGVDYKIVKNIIASQVATATNTLACPFIKTGYIPAYSKKSRMVAKFAYAHTDTTYEYFCGVNHGSRFVFGHASTNNRVYFGLGAQNYTSSYVMDTNVHLYKLDWATAKAFIDDNEYSLTSAGQSDSTGDFWINARHTSTNANANRPMGGTSYWWKFWEGKKLVYNGIPAVRVSDNKVGLFETVNRAFQTTAGTVEYTYTA